MIKAVVDTNIFISGMFWRPSPPYFILELFFKNKLQIVMSRPLFDEIVRKVYQISKRYHSDEKLIAQVFMVLKKSAHFVESLPEVDACRDPKDNMVLATAIAGEAKYIVSGDKDLLVLKSYKGIQITTAQKFLRESKRFLRNNRKK